MAGMRTNYVLIDHENVQPGTLAALEGETFKVLLFVGSQQTKVGLELAQSMQRLGQNARYVQIAGSGANALDFHIAFYIGQLSASEPDAYFHIVSKDTGFDPLVRHLKGKQVFACRSASIADIPAIKAARTVDPQDRIDLIVANLRPRGTSRPRTMRTLSSTIRSLFNKGLSDEDLALLLKELQSRRLIVVQDGKIAYALPPA
jgi:hypothetical protein